MNQLDSISFNPNSEVVSELCHGLGNQLFQYAAARTLADRLNSKLYLNISHYNRSFRKFNLLNFPHLRYDGVLNNIVTNPVIFPVYDYDSSFEQLSGSINLSGHFINIKYFNREIIVNDYRLDVEQQDFIAVHIRRGDLVQSSLRREIGILPICYYNEAFEKFSDEKFVFFTDDQDWLIKNIDQFTCKNKTIFSSSDEFEDFKFMSSAKHFIIANSTYSWWAAVLGKHPEKIVIHPKKWRINKNYEINL